MSIKIRIFFINSSYFLKAICSSGNSFLKLPSFLIMIHPFSIHGQKLTGHFIYQFVTWLYYRSYPRSFELDVLPKFEKKTLTPWRKYKKYLKGLLLLVCGLIVLIYFLVSAFSYTKFSTFYQIVKKKVYIKLHHYFGFWGIIDILLLSVNCVKLMNYIQNKMELLLLKLK